MESTRGAGKNGGKNLALRGKLRSGPWRAGLAVRDIMRRLLERRVAAFLVARTAPDPQVAHTEPALGALPCRGAEARRPAEALRLALRQRMPERAALRPVSEQWNGHPMIMP